MMDKRHEFEDYLSYCASQGIEPVTENKIEDDQNPEDEMQEEDLIEGLIRDRVHAKEYKIERERRN